MKNNDWEKLFNQDNLKDNLSSIAFYIMTFEDLKDRIESIVDDFYGIEDYGKDKTIPEEYRKEVLSKVFRARKESVRLSPKDNKPMNQVHLKGFEIELCRASSHIWLDHGELNKILKTNATTKNNQVIGGEWEWKDLFGSTDAFQFLLEAVVGIILDLYT